MKLNFYFITPYRRHYLGSFEKTDYYYCWKCRQILCQVFEDKQLIELCPKCKTRKDENDRIIDQCYIFIWFEEKFKHNYDLLKKGTIYDEKGKTYFYDQFMCLVRKCGIHILNNRTT